MENEKDDLLFEQLRKAKRRKRRKVIFTVVTLLVLAGAGIFTAVRVLRGRVNNQFAANTAEVKSYAAQTGRISANVSGSGSLSYLDFEDITVPSGVEVEEVLVAAGDVVSAGKELARVDTSSVMTALADTQTALEDLDDQLNKAKKDSVSSYVTSAVPGRVKCLYAGNGDAVMDVMTEHGALAILSLDGKMIVTIEAQAQAGQAVSVVSDGKTWQGTVESSVSGKTVVNFTDDGPIYGAEAEVRTQDGEVLGSGVIAIRNPLAITGYAGTVSWVNVRENQQVYSGGSLFSLRDTQYTANYDALLRTRTETEKTMSTLIGLLKDGCVTAPFDGIITALAEAETSAASAYLGQTTSTADTLIATMAPNKQVAVSVAVDETDILSLELGQNAEITIKSIGEEVYPGKVTEISKIGTSLSGVTQYTAVVTLDKAPQMLSGMTASVDIQIQGVDGVVLIPVDALHKTRNTAYVYTAYNEETKEYDAMVEVVAGTSNSSFVEIVSGLKPGDTVYYTEKTRQNAFGMMPMGGNMNWGSNTGSRGNSSRPSSMTPRNFAGRNMGG